MMPYASRTGTKRNIEAMRRAGWRMLCEPSQLSRYGGQRPPLAYALDNGAWGCFQKGVDFDSESFLKMLGWLGDDADWIVVPDIVQGGLDSLLFSLTWLSRVLSFGAALIAVQDGMETADVSDLLNDRVGIFLGGSTEWKLETMREWGELARKKKGPLPCGQSQHGKKNTPLPGRRGTLLRRDKRYPVFLQSSKARQREETGTSFPRHGGGLKEPTSG